MSTGFFIVFEGGEGAGKSTQVAELARNLRSRGSHVVLTREPGGVPSAEAIRSILLNPANDGLTDRAEALLFAAARAEHAAQLIRPALDRGDVVICDRFIDSSVAYQGVARDLGVDQIADLSAWATEGLLPDLTIVLDIDPVDGLVRAGHTSATPDRMESESLSFHERVRQAFLDRAAASPQRYVVIDATLPADAVAQQVGRAVTALISRQH